jgi:hypothetical protein
MRGRWPGIRAGRVNQVQAELGGVMPAGGVIRRPTPTALHILAAYDLPGLAAKLEAAQEAADS